MENQFDALTASLEESNDLNQRLNENCGNVEYALIESNEKVRTSTAVILADRN